MNALPARLRTAGVTSVTCEVAWAAIQLGPAKLLGRVSVPEACDQRPCERTCWASRRSDGFESRIRLANGNEKAHGLDGAAFRCHLSADVSRWSFAKWRGALPSGLLEREKFTGDLRVDELC